MTATPRVRKQQLAAAITAEEASDPSVYAPFTVREYLRSDWQMADWCTTWPVAQATLPAGPPTPPSGHYGNVPTLVLSGELDSITTAAEGAMVVSQFPNAQQVHFANSFHVTAAGDSDHCAENVVRAFVRRPNQQLSTTVTACATRIPPVRTMGRFPRSVAQVPAATNVAGSTAGVAARKVAVAAAETVTDVIDRWYNNYSGHGYGLHGGTWSYTGYRATKYRFSSVRFVPGLAVSGTAVWLPYQHRMTVNLSVRTTGLAGALHGHWDTRAAGAIAHLHGTLRGAPLAVRFVAP
jgi:hypothetical protein